MEAILLINTVAEDKQEVLEKLLNSPGVLTAYPVYGAYDVVAMSDVEDVRIFEDKLKERIPGIGLITALLPDVKEAVATSPWLY